LEKRKNMSILIYSLCLILGVFMTLHVSMNSQVGIISGNLVFANTVFWVFGAIIALGYYFIRPVKVQMTAAMSVPLWMYTAGIIGVVISLGVIYLIPKAGIINFTILILTGQLICSTVLGSTGFLSESPTPLTFLKILGFALVFMGGYLVVKH
jgi:transporter family-2 protein